MFIFYNKYFSAKRFAQELNVSAFFLHEKELLVRPRELDRAINYGGLLPASVHPSTLNRDTRIARSKVRSFKKFQAAGIRCPIVFETLEEARAYEHGYLARLDKQRGGIGIQILKQGETPERDYDFLVGIIPCFGEYRIHVGKNKDESWRIIATQQKCGVRNNTNIIHNHGNGIFFSTQPLKLSEQGRQRANEMALAAIQAVGLDFGAVDLMQGVDRRLYVLEVNTAPGVTVQSSFTAYLDYFRQFVQE